MLVAEERGRIGFRYNAAILVGCTVGLIKGFLGIIRYTLRIFEDLFVPEFIESQKEVLI